MEQLNLIIDTYQRIILESESKLAKVKQHIYRIGTLRLILFAAGIAGIIYFWDEGRLVIGGIAAITFIPFILLVKLHNRLFHQKDYLEKKIEINRLCSFTNNIKGMKVIAAIPPITSLPSSQK